MKVDGRTTRWPGPLERLMDRVVITTDCWNWDGALRDGKYGTLRFEGRLQMAHRVAWELSVGPIPEEMTLDHLCKNPRCVNPDHLEIVTRGENSNRGDGPTGVNTRKTHCLQGHPFNEDNTYITPKGNRSCKSCRREAVMRHYYRRKL